MTEKLERDVVKAISFVPGLVGLSNIDFSKKAIALFESNWSKGISFTDTPEGIEVAVAAIVGVDSVAKIISEELVSAIKNVFVNADKKISNVVVYIRGVK